jgi:hypothetical protein
MCPDEGVSGKYKGSFVMMTKKDSIGYNARTVTGYLPDNPVRSIPPYWYP